MDYIIFGVIAYLLGSIPTAVWIGRAKYGIDVREHGSKNAGATNTFRILGKKAGVTVLSIDVLKGFTASFLPYLFNVGAWQSEELITVQILASILAVVGHVFPIFAGFRGGKGVATSLGVIFNCFYCFKLCFTRCDLCCIYFSRFDLFYFRYHIYLVKRIFIAFSRSCYYRSPKKYQTTD
jgi:acyl-phosphate glycerol 3-phosphate acyltransferase